MAPCTNTKSITLVVMTSILLLFSFSGNYWNLTTVIMLAGAIWMLVANGNARQATSVAQKIMNLEGAIKGSFMVWITSSIVLGLNVVVYTLALINQAEDDDADSNLTTLLIVGMAMSVLFLSIFIWLGMSSTNCFKARIQELRGKTLSTGSNSFGSMSSSS